MSDITNCVFHLSSSSTVNTQMIEAKVWNKSGTDWAQNFLLVLVNEYENDNHDLAGGSQPFTDDLYLMAGSSIKASDVADWFMDLPWGQHDEAVLSISGNDRGYVCIRGTNGRAERTEWFT